MIERLETIELHFRKESGDWAWEGTSGELVRCKDCKFIKISNGWQVGNTFYCGEFVNCTHPQNNHMSTKIDGFCFRAERKEE